MRARWSGLLLLVALPAGAFWGKNHAHMSENVIEKGSWPTFKRGSRDLGTVDQYLQNVLYLRDGKAAKLHGVDFTTPNCWLLTAPLILPPYCAPPNDSPTDDPTNTRTFVDWVKQGGFAEDGFADEADGAMWAGVRAVNHFHTPYTMPHHPEGGFTGVLFGLNVNAPTPYLEGLFRHGISAADWANGVQSGGQDNNWGWPAAHQSLRRFFTETTAAKRERGLAAAARSIGQVQHLVQDNAIPDHARDLPHPSPGFEEFIRANDSLIDHAFSSWVTFPTALIEQKGLRALWDRDLWDGNTQTPDVTLATTNPVGISEFSNASFFGFNEGGPLGRFSDIPKSPMKWSTFVWPQWQSGDQDDYVANLPPSYPLPAIAHRAGPPQNATDLHLWLDDNVFGAYAAPLMDRLLGYSESTWPLLLTQARAEIVPDPDQPMTLARVRLWNLTPPQTAYAATWYLDSVSVLPILPEGMSGSQFGSNTELPVTFDANSAVGPGGFVESQPFAIDVFHRTFFFYAAYTAVLVTAHLGNGVKTGLQTQLEFGVPIPNAFPLLQQLDVQDTTAAATVGTTCATSTNCGDSSSNVTVRVPFTQHLKMNLTLKAPNVDVLYRKLDSSDAQVRAALEEDVRLAGLAVVSYVATNGNFPDFSMPRYAKNTVFTVGPPGTLIAGGHPASYGRDPHATDQLEAANIPLELELNLKDFISADPDALLASNSTYLAVFTTSGALYLMRLSLWPVFDQKDAATVLNGIGCQDNVLSVAYASVQICAVTGNCASQQYSYAWQYPPMTGGLGFASGSGGLAAAAGAELEALLQLGITKVGSTSIAHDSKGLPANLCTVADYQFPSNDQTSVCADGDQTLGYQSAPMTGGYCMLPAAQNMPHQAQYSPLYTNADDYLWVTQFNLKKSDQPNYTLTAH